MFLCSVAPAGVEGCVWGVGGGWGVGSVGVGVEGGWRTEGALHSWSKYTHTHTHGACGTHTHTGVWHTHDTHTQATGVSTWGSHTHGACGTAGLEYVQACGTGWARTGVWHRLGWSKYMWCVAQARLE